MGPWIILDKSVMQGLSQLAIYELGRYFTSTVPDVLLLEHWPIYRLRPMIRRSRLPPS